MNLWTSLFNFMYKFERGQTLVIASHVLPLKVKDMV